MVISYTTRRDVAAKRVAGRAPITPLCVWLGFRLRAGPLSLAGPWWPGPPGGQALIRRVTTTCPAFQAPEVCQWPSPSVTMRACCCHGVLSAILCYGSGLANLLCNGSLCAHAVGSKPARQEV